MTRRLNTKKRFLPTTPAANGIKPGLSSDTVDDDDRRAKRAMRFVNTANGAGPSTGGSLGDRLGLNAGGGAGAGAGFGRIAQGGKHGYGGNKMYGAQEAEAVYDPVSQSTPACLTSGIAQLTAYPNLQNVIDWDTHTIVGTSTKLEKPYLRLTEVRDVSSCGGSVGAPTAMLTLPV